MKKSCGNCYWLQRPQPFRCEAKILNLRCPRWAAGQADSNPPPLVGGVVGLDGQTVEQPSAGHCKPLDSYDLKIQLPLPGLGVGVNVK